GARPSICRIARRWPTRIRSVGRSLPAKTRKKGRARSRRSASRSSRAGDPGRVKVKERGEPFAEERRVLGVRRVGRSEDDPLGAALHVRLDRAGELFGNAHEDVRTWRQTRALDFEG